MARTNRRSASLRPERRQARGYYRQRMRRHTVGQKRANGESATAAEGSCAGSLWS